jgi:hypothetical protein
MELEGDIIHMPLRKPVCEDVTGLSVPLPVWAVSNLPASVLDGESVVAMLKEKMTN